MTEYTDMMKSYLKVKADYSDCIVFYRLGDFYEMFFEDAVKASEILGLTLTGRACGKNQRAPMCGVPYHAADNYIAKLINAGEKVAICEQLSEPKRGELVKRDVVKIVTAGTITESELIDENKNNYIACIKSEDNNLAVAWADITTGDFFVRSFNGKNKDEELLDFLVKISPAEIIADNKSALKINQTPAIIHKVLPKVYSVKIEYFEQFNYINAIKKQFNQDNLLCFNIPNDENIVGVVGVLLQYLYETQKHALNNITKVEFENGSDYMQLDATAIRNLELVKSNRDNKTYGTLSWVLNKTKTSMGARILNNWILYPLIDKAEIQNRLDSVDAFYKSTLLTQNVCDTLKQIKDIARLTGKISNGNLTPCDCIALSNSLSVMPALKIKLSGLYTPLLTAVDNALIDFSPIVNLISSAIVSEDTPNTTKDGNFIKKGFSEELDELKEISKNSKSYIANLENVERNRTGIKNLKIGFNRVFGYYIEVTNSFKDLVPINYVRKQTIANAERYVTEELKVLEEKILMSDEKSLRLEQALFLKIKEFLSSYIPSLLTLANAIGTLDVIVSLAQVAKTNNYVKPNVLSSNEQLNIVGGRHPVVEAISKEKFVPNDTILDIESNRMAIITGPNMAGKSTYMRQTALIVLMAQIGSFVPAKSANIPICDKIFTRVGASDNLILDQSTFMVEMSEVAYILKNATPYSLIVLDEIGRGTSTYDGLSIAWAVIEYICQNVKAKTLFATHYHELTELENTMEGVKNYKVTVKEFNNTVIFLRKIVRGGANRSFGIEVALLAGVPAEITTRAKLILKELEKKSVNNSTFNVEREVDTTIKERTKVENIILGLDFNNLTPIKAFNILQDLKEIIEE